MFLGSRSSEEAEATTLAAALVDPSPAPPPPPAAPVPRSTPESRQSSISILLSVPNWLGDESIP